MVIIKIIVTEAFEEVFIEVHTIGVTLLVIVILHDIAFELHLPIFLNKCLLGIIVPVVENHQAVVAILVVRDRSCRVQHTKVLGQSEILFGAFVATLPSNDYSLHLCALRLVGIVKELCIASATALLVKFILQEIRIVGIENLHSLFYIVVFLRHEPSPLVVPVVYAVFAIYNAIEQHHIGAFLGTSSHTAQCWLLLGQFICSCGSLRNFFLYCREREVFTLFPSMSNAFLSVLTLSSNLRIHTH